VVKKILGACSRRCAAHETPLKEEEKGFLFGEPGFLKGKYCKRHHNLMGEKLLHDDEGVTRQSLFQKKSVGDRKAIQGSRITLLNQRLLGAATVIKI